jgi:phosphatidate cytidylyltransferase
VDEDPGAPPSDEDDNRDEEKRRVREPTEGADPSGRAPGDEEKRRVREPTEGVRIIGAEEAAEAAGRRDVVSRLPEDAPRYGDRPSGPGDEPPPARISREADDPNTFGAVPIISADSPPPPELEDLGSDEPPATESFEMPDRAPSQAAEEDDLSRILGGRRDDSSRRARRSKRRGRRGRDEGGAGPEEAPWAAPTGEVELPHWTKPPTGEVPQVVAGESAAAGPPEDEELDVWAGLSSEPRWRDQPPTEPPVEYAAGPDETTVDVGGGRAEPPPPQAEDIQVNPPPPPPPPIEPTAPIEPPPEPQAEPEPGYEPEPSLTAGSPYPERRRGDHGADLGHDEGGGAGRDLPMAVMVGVGLAAVYLVLAQIGGGALTLLALVVVVLAAVEFFGAVRRVGYHPAVLPGLVGVACFVLGVHWKGEAAFPLVTFLVLAVLMLWYVIGLAHERAVANIGITLLGVMWIGGLGSFAGLMLALPLDFGVAFLSAAIFATVAYDVGAFFVGRQMGKTHFSDASPNKTVEGLVGGAVAAILMSVIFSFFVFPFELVDGIVLGLAVAVVAPIGDLCESMMKRDLGIKDMGSILPGHGGVLDRFDALLFVLPATYYVVRIMDTMLNTP